MRAPDLTPGSRGEEDAMAEAGEMIAGVMDAEARVLPRARTLAQAIGGSAPFRAFEAARKALVTDVELMRRLRRYQSRERELAPLRAHGDADPREDAALEAEWRSLWEIPVVRAYLQTQAELETVLETVAHAITEAAGVDYALACAAGGCCS